jgi:hypothetical protein
MPAALVLECFGGAGTKKLAARGHWKKNLAPKRPGGLTLLAANGYLPAL